MNWSDAHNVVEMLRQDTRLYLPTLSTRLGFSCSRVEHLLNQLVAYLPRDECYLEVGVLHGRTLEAASINNDEKTLIGCDPCIKYGPLSLPLSLPPNVIFLQQSYQDVSFPAPIGVVFYDADHGEYETAEFFRLIEPSLADEAVVVLDDWDRVSVRAGAFKGTDCDPRWRLLREMPEYTDGNGAPHWFGYFFGVGIWGFKR